MTTDICLKMSEQVNENDVLLTIESMKMQYPIKSTVLGTIKNILVELGNVTEQN